MKVGNISHRVLPAACAAVVGAAAAGGGIAIASSTSSSNVHGCVGKKTHLLAIAKKCNKKTATPLTFAKRGPAGPIGKTGAAGPTGATGATGAQGPAGSAQAWGTFIPGIVPQNQRNLSIGAATAPGVYPVTLSVCTTGSSIAVTPELGGTNPTAVTPVAYAYRSGATGASFSVVVGYMSGGTFTPEDGNEGFDVAVYC